MDPSVRCDGNAAWAALHHATSSSEGSLPCCPRSKQMKRVKCPVLAAPLQAFCWRGNGARLFAVARPRDFSATHDRGRVDFARQPCPPDPCRRVQGGL
eukprot:8958170-Pyramimonas_sp.AAC.1